MKPLISLNEVSMSYSRKGSLFRKTTHHPVLSNVTFDIYQGETLGVIGRNGTGKSTLLQLISGVLHPTQGQINRRGASISLLNLQAGFKGDLSGRDNVIFCGLLLGFSRKEIIHHLEEIKEYSELGDAFHLPVRTYSSGMRSRLGFSLSIIMQPDVLLIDEALSVGDQQFRQKAEKSMASILNSEQTVVFVSHAHAQIRRLCERAVFLEGGSVVTIGPVEPVVSLYEKRIKEEKMK